MTAQFSAHNVWDFRELARARLPRAIFEYVDRGAEDEVALAHNRLAFERVKFRPRTLTDVSKRDQSITLFGKPRKMPLAIAPTGSVGLVWLDAELELARAAGAAGIPMTLATSGTVPMERIAEAATSGYWQQLYLWDNRDLSDEIIARANAANAEALLLTVDTAVGANREYNLRNGFSSPFQLSPRIVTDVLLHPRWLATVMGRYFLNGGMPRFVNYPAGARHRITGEPMRQSVSSSVSWNDVRRIRDLWPRKFVLKGVLSPEDAMRAADHGVDGIVVSNHGGRMLDSAQAPIEVLPEIVAAVGDRMTVLLDSGVRRGADVVKALALGANAVLIGRATLYGMAAGGAAGAGRVLDILRGEIDSTLALLGCRNIAELGPDLVRLPK
jgi:isopentenyl diphosphate isomerase/L-lactate dehydrogenase-like FMN-dependent dehydrogenase